MYTVTNTANTSDDNTSGLDYIPVTTSLATHQRGILTTHTWPYQYRHNKNDGHNDYDTQHQPTYTNNFGYSHQRDSHR
jgi:hypothetical protein